MLINKASLNAIFTGIKTIFNNALKAVETEWRSTTMIVKSSSKGE